MITASLNTRLTALLTSEGSGGEGLGVPLGVTGPGVDLVSAGAGSSRLTSGGLAQLSERMHAPATTATGADVKSLIQVWFIVSSCLGGRSLGAGGSPRQSAGSLLRVICLLTLKPVTSQRLQELNKIRLLGGRQVVKKVPRECAAGTRVALNCLVEGERQPVVHQHRASAHTPQRRCSQHVPGGLAAVLDDPVTGPDIVQHEITERVDDLVPQI